jgi:hypothetical protein
MKGLLVFSGVLFAGLALGIFLLLLQIFIFKVSINLSIIPICMAGIFCFGLIVIIVNKKVYQTRFIFSIITGSVYFGLFGTTAFFLILYFIFKQSPHPLTVVITYILGIFGSFFAARNYMYPSYKDNINKEKITDV